MELYSGYLGTWQPLIINCNRQSRSAGESVDAAGWGAAGTSEIGAGWQIAGKALFLIGLCADGLLYS